MVRWVVRSILHGVDPLSYFLFQPVLHDWCNKGRGMCYPVCGMVHIKEPLMLIDKSSLCGGNGFPFSLSEWSLTICLTPYNRILNVLSASLNKTFLSLTVYGTLIRIVSATTMTQSIVSWTVCKCCNCKTRKHRAISYRSNPSSSREVGYHDSRNDNGECIQTIVKFDVIYTPEYIMITIMIVIIIIIIIILIIIIIIIIII